MDYEKIGEDYKSGKMARFFKVAMYMLIAVGVLALLYWLY